VHVLDDVVDVDVEDTGEVGLLDVAYLRVTERAGPLVQDSGREAQGWLTRRV
jgi:hypothetical protein